MKKLPALLGVIAVMLFLCPAALADDVWTISLLPGPDISGPAGSTIGWGFTITNFSSTDSLILDGVSADSFAHATANANVFSFPIVDPNSGFSVTYNPGVDGLYELTWDADAPVGFVNSGTFYLDAHFCDPADLGCTDTPEQELTLSYSATVSAATTVPEPATTLLLAAGVAAATLLRRRPA